jgi:hypothetical protein
MPTTLEKIQEFLEQNQDIPFEFNSDTGLDCYTLTERFLKKYAKVTLPDRQYIYDNWDTDPAYVSEQVRASLGAELDTVDLETDTLQPGDVFVFMHKALHTIGLMISEKEAVGASQSVGIIRFYPEDYTIIEAFRPVL